MLTVTSSKIKGNWSAYLSWSGFESTVTAVNVLRNGAVLAGSQPNNGSYTDSGKGGGTFTYQVCATGTQTCTNAVTISP